MSSTRAACRPRAANTVAPAPRSRSLVARPRAAARGRSRSRTCRRRSGGRPSGEANQHLTWVSGSGRPSRHHGGVERGAGVGGDVPSGRGTDTYHPRTAGRRAAGELLRTRDATAMAVGGMIGGGIFSVLGVAITLAGHLAVGCFVVGAGVAAVTAALVRGGHRARRTVRRTLRPPARDGSHGHRRDAGVAARVRLRGRDGRLLVHVRALRGQRARRVHVGGADADGRDRSGVLLREPPRCPGLEPHGGPDRRDQARRARRHRGDRDRRVRARPALAARERGRARAPSARPRCSSRTRASS